MLLAAVEGFGARRARACAAPPGHQTTAKQVNPYSVQGVVVLAVVGGWGRALAE